MDDLEKKYPQYFEIINIVNRNLTAYNGIDALIENDYLIKSESYNIEKRYNKRKMLAINFELTQYIATEFSSFLSSSLSTTKYESVLQNDKLFNNFINDCNKRGESIYDFLNSAQELSLVTGFLGILISSTNQESYSLFDQQEKNIYPVLKLILPHAIYDFTFDYYGLSYLKLKLSETKIIEYYRNEIIEWTILDKNTSYIKHDNLLGIIPFIFMQAKKNPLFDGLGIPILSNSARVDITILNEMSWLINQIEYASFPIPIIPPVPEGQNASIKVGPDIPQVFQALQGLDGKSTWEHIKWLKPEISQSVDAIIKKIDWMINKLLVTMRLSSVVSTSLSQSARSGESLEREMDHLNGLLTSLNNNKIQALYNIIYIYCKFFDHLKDIDIQESVNVETKTKFNVADLLSNINDHISLLLATNSTTLKEIVVTRLINKLYQKKDKSEVIKKINQELIESEDNLGN